MLLPRQLLVSTLALFLLSCNNTDKQKELSNSDNITKKSVSVDSERTETNPDTISAIDKPTLPVILKRRRGPLPIHQILKRY